MLALFVVTAAVMLWVGQRLGDRIEAGFRNAWNSVAAFFDSDSEPAKATGEHEKDAATRFFTCGMHPWVILPKPGDCPICHMKLTPLDPSKFTGEITIDPVVVQNIGVRIAPVTKGPLVQTIRTVGTVAYDETRVRDVNIKVEGWIEKLFVDYIGAEVEKNAPLFDLFSRTLYSAQEEYLIAWRNRDQKGVGFVPRVAEDLEQNLDAARTRLELFDIGEDQIRELERAGKQSKTMTIRSPHEGVVTEKTAFEGMHVAPGMRVFRIADLSRVWVMVTLYEYQLPFVEVGQKARMTLPYIPGQVYEGEVTYKYPWVEGRTREVRVRLEFDNPGFQLRPGMFADVEIKSVLAEERVLAPRSAIIDTGERRIAFVSLGRGKFEPRMLQLGPETEGGNVAVLDGLRPGEMVVTSGQFLLDSESKIREALGKMIRGETASEQEAVASAAGPSELDHLPEAAASALGKLLESYFAIGSALASDRLDGIKDASRRIAASVDVLLGVELPETPHFWHRHEEVATVRGKALELVGKSDLAAVRLAFADLSIALAKLTRATGVPRAVASEVLQYHCPMFREGQGGSIWLQRSGEVRNPFYGAQMLGCFDESRALPVTGGRPKAVPSPAGKQAAIDSLFKAYLGIQDGLANDSLADVADLLEAARSRLEQLAKASDAKLAAAARAVRARLMSETGDLEGVRKGFEGLSESMIDFARSFPPSKHVAPALKVAHCPMKKASWLQTTDEIRNPFYGSDMLRCGSIEGTIPAVEGR